MILNFIDRETAKIAVGSVSRKLPNDIQERARMLLRRVAGASRLDDLRIPPGNHLEALKRDRAGQHSVRINRQWRICFRWDDGDARDVEICDYH